MCLAFCERNNKNNQRILLYGVCNSQIIHLFECMKRRSDIVWYCKWFILNGETAKKRGAENKMCAAFKGT